MVFEWYLLSLSRSAVWYSWYFSHSLQYHSVVLECYFSLTLHQYSVIPSGTYFSFPHSTTTLWFLSSTCFFHSTTTMWFLTGTCTYFSFSLSTTTVPLPCRVWYRFSILSEVSTAWSLHLPSLSCHCHKPFNSPSKSQFKTSFKICQNN